MGSTGCTLLLVAAIAAQAVAFGDMKGQVVYGLPVSATGICVRVFNATHQFGCGSSMNGNEGVLVHASSKMDLEGATDGWKERFPNYDGDFVLLMKESLLDRSTAPMLMSASRVSGILLIPSEDDKIDKTLPLSAEAACPNGQLSLYSDWRACGSSAAKQWNGQGAMLEQGLRFTDWAKPMNRLINASVIASMVKCHDAYNVKDEEANKEEGREGRLCAVSMKMFMQGSGSSAECIRRYPGTIFSQLNQRQLCEPLHDLNVFVVIPPGVQNKTAGGGNLAIIARMDGVAMIQDASPASMGTMSAVVAALMAAKVVGDNLATFEAASKKSNKRIIFAFLHGEAYDYVGSSRWVYDMERGTFPKRQKVESHEDVLERIGLDRISLALELQQIDDSTQLYAHVDGKNYDADEKGKIKKALETMSAAMGGDKVDTSRVNGKGVLPPSSLHSILKRKRQIPSLLLTSFGDQYSNRRLHSTYDRMTGDKAEEISLKESMAKVAKGVVALMAEHVGIDETMRDNLKIDLKWMDMLTECFIVSTKLPECRYLQDINGKTVIDPPDRSTWISATGRSYVKQFIKDVLVVSTGEHNSTSNVRSRESCTHVNDNQALYEYAWEFDPWKNETFCYRTSVYDSSAMSPAFIRNEHGDYYFDGANPSTWNYSTWAEAIIVESREYQLFLIDSRPVDWLMIMAGLLTTLVALLIVGRCDDSSFIVDEGERAAEAGEPL